MSLHLSIILSLVMSMVDSKSHTALMNVKMFHNIIVIFVFRNDERIQVNKFSTKAIKQSTQR